MIVLTANDWCLEVNDSVNRIWLQLITYTISGEQESPYCNLTP